jgi:hypothetical protein
MKQPQEQPKFELQLIPPFSTFTEGTPMPTPYTVDGLLPQGGFSVLGAKPKAGKSSLARFEAVSVSKGASVLGRTSQQGEVILISLEDPRHHTDNCLHVLGHDPKKDAQIHIVEQLSPNIDVTIEAIGSTLVKMPDVRLVIVDTLMKLLRIDDVDKYVGMMTAVEKLRNLARQFPRVHIQGLSHCKKVKCDDPFDALLGSTALRGETDANIALFQDGGDRVIATETRIGRAVPQTLLNAQLITSAGADVVQSFSLGESLEERKAKQKDRAQKKRKQSYEARVVTYLSSQENDTATQTLVLEELEGKTEKLLEAIHTLAADKVLTITGAKHSPSDPLKLTLNRDSLWLHDLLTRFDGRED